MEKIYVIDQTVEFVPMVARMLLNQMNVEPIKTLDSVIKSKAQPDARIGTAIGMEFL